MKDKTELKNRIKENAFKQFATLGYSGVKTDDLAKKCGISKRTLYELFGSKEKLFHEIMITFMEYKVNYFKEMIERIREADKETYIDEFYKLLHFENKDSGNLSVEHILDIKKNAPNVWNSIDDYRNEHFSKYFKEIFRRGKELGLIREDVDPDFIYLIQNVTFSNVFSSEVIANMDVTVKELVTKVHELFLLGTLTPNSKEKYLNIESK